jgi:membrane-associated phospholipid phosphatase
MAVAGLACLSASVVLGFVTRRRETWFDQLVPTVARQFVPPHGTLVHLLGGEAYWPHGAYVTALAPVAVTVAVLGRQVHRDGLRPVLDRWRWVLLTVAAIPLHYAVRVALARPGPGELPSGPPVVGAYPSGTAVAVGLGWVLCLVVVGGLRRRWRPWLVVAATIALLVHGIVRVITNKHWATDILGSYLLVIGAFLIAGTARPDPCRQRLPEALASARGGAATARRHASCSPFRGGGGGPSRGGGIR